MKLLRNTLIGLLAVICVAATAVTLMTVFGDDSATLERRPPDRTQGEALSTGNVFEVVSDPLVWQDSVYAPEEGEAWRFFPEIPLGVQPGDTVILNIPSSGFLTWEFSLPDLEFSDEPSNADYVRASFVVPEEPVAVWALYEYNPHGVESISNNLVEHGGLPIGPDVPLIVSIPITRQTTNVQLSFGMWGNRYEDRLYLIDDPDNFGFTAPDVSAASPLFDAFMGGGGPGGHGPGHHGLRFTNLGRNISVATFWNEHEERNTTIEPFDWGEIGVGEPGLGDLPDFVTTFTFPIDISWTEDEGRYEPNPDYPAWLDEYETIPDPNVPDEIWVENPLRRVRQTVNATLVVLPLPIINEGSFRDAGNVTIRPAARPMLDGMQGVHYGGSTRQMLDSNDEPMYDTLGNPILEWVTDGHFTSVGVYIPAWDDNPATNPWPNLAGVFPETGLPDPNSGLTWVFSVRTSMSGAAGAAPVDQRFVPPERVADARPTFDVILRNLPTEYDTTNGIDQPLTPTAGNNTAGTFGVGRVTFVLRLAAFVPHPERATVPAGMPVRPIGFIEREFHLDILPRPQFGLSAGEGIINLDATALGHMMADQTLGSDEPAEDLAMVRDTIWATGLPASADGGYTMWRFTYDFEKPRAGSDGGPQRLFPDQTATGSGFTSNLPPGLNLTYLTQANGSLDVMLGRAKFDLTGVPTPDTFGRFTVGVEVDSFLEPNKNIRTYERAEFELIIWPRTYMHLNTVPTGMGGHVRRVDANGVPEQTTEFVQSPANSSRFELTRAVMPGTMGIISAQDTNFVRWEFQPIEQLATNLNLEIGGTVGTNAGAPGHTQYTGHLRTAEHNFMTMRMPVPMNGNSYDPYFHVSNNAPTIGADVLIRGVRSTPPSIIFAGEPGRVDLPDPRGFQIVNGGEAGDQRPFRWVILPGNEPDAGLGLTFAGSNAVGGLVFINPTMPTRPGEPYEFTLSAFLQGTMRIDFPLSIAVTGRPGRGDINLDGRIDYWDLILLARHFEGETLTGQSLENADIDGNGSVTLADLTYFRRIFGIREVGIVETP
ncbi:MAG: dockerin type I repeat-containing protein [Defluviitaleaceae bacterium]|nr:dockerin type I repeat-containing protein [Defluviitaleaceae bacterium]